MKICPECNYRRTGKDSLIPDYECPACGIIFEKDKARQALAELEEQKQVERQAKLERLKREKEQKIRQEQARLQREERERRAREETERIQKLEAERKLREEEEKKRRKEEERLKREEQEQKAVEEKARLQKIEAELKQKEKEEQNRKQEEERLKREEQARKAAEEAARIKNLEADRARREEEEHRRREEKDILLKEAAEKLRREELTRSLRKEHQEKIAQMARENPDKVISPPGSEKTYQLFDMCPFGMAQAGKGLSIVPFGETKNKGQHARCMQKFCRLWTWKMDDKGLVYAQGCTLQFLGLSREEIKKNFSLKNLQILEETYHPADESSSSASRE